MDSQLPSPVSFTAPQAGGASAWGPFLRGLNKFVQQTVTAFQVLGASGPVYKTLTIGPSSAPPLLIDNPLGRPPRDIHIAQLIPWATAPLEFPVTLVWSITSTGQILVSNILSLDDEETYDIVLAVA